MSASETSLTQNIHPKAQQYATTALRLFSYITAWWALTFAGLQFVGGVLDLGTLSGGLLALTSGQTLGTWLTSPEAFMILHLPVFFFIVARLALGIVVDQQEHSMGLE